MGKKIIANCCEKIIVEEKDLKEGIYKEKGYEFEWEMDSKLKFTKLWEDIFTLRRTQRQGYWKRFRLLENIKLKYTICPVCGDKIWLDEPYNGYWILEGNWKVKELKSWKSEWEDFL